MRKHAQRKCAGQPRRRVSLPRCDDTQSITSIECTGELGVDDFVGRLAANGPNFNVDLDTLLFDFPQATTLLCAANPPANANGTRPTAPPRPLHRLATRGEPGMVSEKSVTRFGMTILVAGGHVDARISERGDEPRVGKTDEAENAKRDGQGAA